MTRTSSEQTIGRVLVVDDHAAVRESVIDILRQAGYAVDGLASAVEALPALERLAPDVVITDLQMPGIDGLEFIRQISRRRLPTQVIMITAHATIASAGFIRSKPRPAHVASEHSTMKVEQSSAKR